VQQCDRSGQERGWQRIHLLHREYPVQLFVLRCRCLILAERSGRWMSEPCRGGGYRHVQRDGRLQSRRRRSMLLLLQVVLFLRTRRRCCPETHFRAHVQILHVLVGSDEHIPIATACLQFERSGERGHRRGIRILAFDHTSRMVLLEIFATFRGRRLQFVRLLLLLLLFLMLLMMMMMMLMYRF